MTLTEELAITWIRAYTVYDRKGELSLGQVLRKALVRRVLISLQIHVVVPDLEENADQVDEGHIIATTGVR